MAAFKIHVYRGTDAGANLPINVKNLPVSSLYALFAEPSRVEINPDTITADDDMHFELADETVRRLLA